MPYWLYQDEANYRAELRRIFEGPTWSFICLEANLPQPYEVGIRIAAARRIPIVLENLTGNWGPTPRAVTAAKVLGLGTRISRRFLDLTRRRAAGGARRVGTGWDS